jgi:molybdopterin-guanine dinucleotide biosynthesis protein A
MGTNKALMPIAGNTILGHVVRRLRPQVQPLLLNAPLDFADTHDLSLVPDTLPDQAGPLAGVLAGLLEARASGHSHLLTAPCDSPFLPADLATRLRAARTDDAQIVVAASQGRSHPVFAIWPNAIADDLERWLGDPDNRRINAYLRRHRVVTAEFPLIKTGAGMLDPFLNLNTPDDLAEAQPFLGLLA